MARSSPRAARWRTASDGSVRKTLALPPASGGGGGGGVGVHKEDGLVADAPNERKQSRTEPAGVAAQFRHQFKLMNPRPGPASSIAGRRGSLMRGSDGRQSLKPGRTGSNISAQK